MPVVFRCGPTGSFLDGGAFNGLMGLGKEKVSVAGMLTASGLVASDSFSMCFSEDVVGRINFGDAGIRGQGEMPFISTPAARLGCTGREGAQADA